MKKLLLTIIILGACLVGSSQNWDSIRVGNLDVDSIMLGGAKIWEKQTITPPPSVIVTMTTTSTSSSWSPWDVINSGATLHWEVTGTVTTSADADQPTFDFSTAGEKIITITSTDDLTGLQYLDLYDNQLTSFDATGLTGLQYLDLSSNQLTSFDATGLTGLQELYLISNQLTSFDATGLTGLQDINLYGNHLTTIAINSVLDKLITIGTAGNYLAATAQVGGGCGNPAKIAALDAIWNIVLVDSCP